MPNNERSKVIIFDSKAKTEEFKRPNHHDFMTTTELKAARFSGSRNNSLTQMIEIWVDGEIVENAPIALVKQDPLWIQKIYNKHFGL